MKVLRVSLVSVLAASLLSGCAGPTADAGAEGSASSLPESTMTPTATPSATVTTSSPASATPTPEATGTPKPDLTDLSVSSEGVGYIVIGHPVPDKPKPERIVRWEDDYCDTGGDGPGAFETLYPRGDDGHLAFFVDTGTERDAPVTVIYVQSVELRTEHDLGVGSTAAEIKAQGGKKVDDVAPENYTTYVIHGSEGELVFWLDENEDDTVAFYQIQREGRRPQFGFEITPCA